MCPLACWYQLQHPGQRFSSLFSIPHFAQLHQTYKMSPEFHLSGHKTTMVLDSHRCIILAAVCVWMCKILLKKKKKILNPSRFISLSFKFFKDMLSHIFSGSLFSGSAFFPEVEGYLWADGAHRCFLISTSYRAKGTRSCCICSCISSIATASQ